MRVLDLFAGTRGWSAAFEARGHDVVSVELEPDFPGITIVGDVRELRAADLPWKPDIILASPPCTSFSMMTVGRNWTHEGEPKTPKAELGRELVMATRRLITELEPAYFFIENPRARLRTLGLLGDYERRTIWQCRYGRPYAKPTDLWGGYPPSLVLRPGCRNGDPDHVAAPRGSRTGVPGRQDPLVVHAAGGVRREVLERQSRAQGREPRRGGHPVRAVAPGVPRRGAGSRSRRCAVTHPLARWSRRMKEHPMTSQTPSVTDAPLDANELDSFNRWAARWMRRRLDDGARKFGALSWRREEYSDADNIARLHRAVEHLTGILEKWRDPATAEFIDVTELGKRAADVANQAFMLADIQRRETPSPPRPGDRAMSDGEMTDDQLASDDRVDASYEAAPAPTVDAAALAEAWAEVEAALPDGWRFAVGSSLNPDKSVFVAWAGANLGAYPFEVYDSTPTAALRALAAVLRGDKP